MPEITTTRPVAATVLAILQTVIALANIVVAAIVLVTMRSPEVAPHAREAVHEVMLNAVIIVAAAVATTFAAIGLWRRWTAAWALTLALSLTVVLGMLWGPMFDHDHMERDDLAVTVAFAVTFVLALLGPVVRWYVHHEAATTVAAGTAQSKSGF